MRHLTIRIFCSHLLIVLGCCTCSVQMGADTPRLPAVSIRSVPRPPLAALDAAESTTLQKDARDLDCPPGVDAGLWEDLKSALAGAIRSRTTSQLPDESRNAVSDAAVVDDGAGGFNLTWTYRNVGDYDSNSEVNISDLTAIGLYFQDSQADSDWSSGGASADGDANGEVNIGDITPLGQNLGSEIQGYFLYQSENEGGPWAALGQVALAQASPDFPRRFSFPLGATPPAHILISAYDSSGDDWQGGPDPIPAEVNLGTDVPLLTQSVGTSGGILAGPAGSPIEGVTVEIPSDAFAIDTQVSIGYNDGSITPVVGEQLGPILEITTDYGQSFGAPLTVTLPYSGAADEIPIPFYIDEENGNLEYCDLSDLNPGAGTFSFVTDHASAFAVILARAANPLEEYYDTKFDPKKDGFQIDNVGSSFNAEGECLGMCWFATRTYSRGNTDLYNLFMQEVPGSGGLKGQDVIATRAHNAIHSKWDTYIPEVKWQTDKLSDEQEWLVMRYVLVNTALPVIVTLTKPDASNGHAVLGFAFVGDDLFVYDPNEPGTTQIIVYGDIGFNPYGPYSRFATIGQGNTSLEHYEAILVDASNGFSSPDAVLAFSPPVGESTDQSSVTIFGSVDSSQVLIERIRFIADGNAYEGSVSEFGVLPNLSLPIRNGNNYFKVLTFGRSARNTLIHVKNNLTDTRGIVIIGEGVQPPPTPELRLDLIWTNSAPPPEYPVGTAVLCAKVVPSDGSGPYILDGHSGAATAPNGVKLLVGPPGDILPGGTQSILVDSSVTGSGTIFYSVHRTDVNPEPTGWGYRIMRYIGTDPQGTMLEGAYINNGDTENTPDWDAMTVPSESWSPIWNYGY